MADTMPAKTAATFAAYPAATLVLEGMGCKNGNGYMTATFASTCRLTGRRIAYGEGIQKVTFWTRAGDRFQGYIANTTKTALGFQMPPMADGPDVHESYSTFRRCAADWWVSIGASEDDVLEVVNWKPGAHKSTGLSYRKTASGWQKGDKFGVRWGTAMTDKQFAALLRRTKSNFLWRVFPGYPIEK